MWLICLSKHYKTESFTRLLQSIKKRDEIEFWELKSIITIIKHLISSGYSWESEWTWRRDSKKYVDEGRGGKGMENARRA